LTRLARIGSTGGFTGSFIAHRQSVFIASATIAKERRRAA